MGGVVGLMLMDKSCLEMVMDGESECGEEKKTSAELNLVDSSHSRQICPQGRRCGEIPRITRGRKYEVDGWNGKSKREER